ncbi:Macrophage receptor MARCO [Buceros rhinoceros silvestris]|uniref:Macrophage receptor MARCO n=1 Tax=Buceros rhinoceros silvestris TaxID=175836 RepID=A0A091HB57_BUCRH|nr:Macrophage receptor MARCO [Buceros rhinoceros silvestris]
MKIKDSLWEEGNLSNTSPSSVSDKIGFASAATTTFQISEPRSRRKPSACCARAALSAYLLLLTVGQGLLMYKVFMMQKEILKLQEQNISYTEKVLESSFTSQLRTGPLDNWRRSLEQEITVMKVSNANMMTMMKNITLITGPPGLKGDPGPPVLPQRSLTTTEGHFGSISSLLPHQKSSGLMEELYLVLICNNHPKSPREKREDHAFSGMISPKSSMSWVWLPQLKRSMGEPGRPGQKGEPGLSGQRGPAGIPGSNGSPGQKGEKGDQGFKGSQGTPGTAGLRGEKGDNGVKGLPGEKGTKGDRGPQGFPGPHGEKGSKGDTGRQGLKGERGVKGAMGDRGYSGSPGTKGSKGEKGEANFRGYIRIAGGGRRGRVEILHNGSWGTICDDGWTIVDANVACRMLGYSTAISSFTASAGSGQIWLDDVNCSGNESSLFDCSKPDWGVNNCSHSEDAGVECA